MTNEEAIKVLEEMYDIYDTIHEETDLDYGFLEMQTIDIAIEALLSANADGCDGCKYVNKDEYEMPCLVCKRNHVDKWTPRKD